MTLHELAHGWVAWKLGDPTAKLLGPHLGQPDPDIDPLGTAMFAITYFGSSFIFGWAKPIPVGRETSATRRWAWRSSRRPARSTNFVIALVFAAIYYHVSSRASLVPRRPLLLSTSTSSSASSISSPSRRSTARASSAPSWTRTPTGAGRALDQYGMIFLLLIFFVFNRQFSIIIREATNAVANVMRRSSGARCHARPRPGRSCSPRWRDRRLRALPRLRPGGRLRALAITPAGSRSGAGPRRAPACGAPRRCR